jgi:hypothetical protein
MNAGRKLGGPCEISIATYTLCHFSRPLPQGPGKLFCALPIADSSVQQSVRSLLYITRENGEFHLKKWKIENLAYKCSAVLPCISFLKGHNAAGRFVPIRTIALSVLLVIDALYVGCAVCSPCQMVDDCKFLNFFYSFSSGISYMKLCYCAQYTVDHPLL